MVLKITNLHILRHLPTCWLYLLERYTVDNQRCTHTASEKVWHDNKCYIFFCFPICYSKEKNQATGILFQKHVDIAKDLAKAEPEYYTTAEAMEKYNLTRDQLYHYVKWHHISKVQEGKYIKISRKELDDLLAPPSI